MRPLGFVFVSLFGKIWEEFNDTLKRFFIFILTYIIFKARVPK